VKSRSGLKKNSWRSGLEAPDRAVCHSVSGRDRRRHLHCTKRPVPCSVLSHVDAGQRMCSRRRDALNSLMRHEAARYTCTRRYAYVSVSHPRRWSEAQAPRQPTRMGRTDGNATVSPRARPLAKPGRKDRTSI
jgi:hypothetical protein